MFRNDRPTKNDIFLTLLLNIENRIMFYRIYERLLVPKHNSLQTSMCLWATKTFIYAL